jgi:hypothetical protein
MSLSSGEFIIWQERGMGGERGRSAGRHISSKVRFRRDRGERQRYREIQDKETRRLETELTRKILSKAG